jgi:hypothetical protein
MNRCPYCGHSNHPAAIQCRKCENFLVSAGGTVYCPAKPPLVGRGRAHDIRNKALAAIALGLLIRVYWGGYGPWPVVDDPILVRSRQWLEPCLLYGGTLGYFVGCLLRWI